MPPTPQVLQHAHQDFAFEIHQAKSDTRRQYRVQHWMFFANFRNNVFDLCLWRKIILDAFGKTVAATFVEQKRVEDRLHSIPILFKACSGISVTCWR